LTFDARFLVFSSDPGWCQGVLDRALRERLLTLPYVLLLRSGTRCVLSFFGGGVARTTKKPAPGTIGRACWRARTSSWTPSSTSPDGSGARRHREARSQGSPTSYTSRRDPGPSCGTK